MQGDAAEKEAIVLGLSTFPDLETARKIATELVEARLAACANILGRVESIYSWKGKIENGNEIVVFFKISRHRQSEFQEKLRKMHPYEVPEIIFTGIDGGLPEYFRWVVENCL